MRLKITLKADAAERARGRCLDPVNVVLCADGRLLHPRHPGSTLGACLDEVTDLVDVEVAEDLWQVVLTRTQIDVVLADLDRLVHSYSEGGDRRQLYRGLKDAFSKAEPCLPAGR